MASSRLTAVVIELLLLVATSSSSSSPNTSTSFATLLPPQLSGQHFRITVVETETFLKVTEEEDDDDDEEKDGDNNTNNGKRLSFSGYLIDMLKALAANTRANFTYTLLTPSGLGEFCEPQLMQNNSTSPQEEEDLYYSAIYRSQFECGSSDVNDNNVSTNFSTDMYLGTFYISPERQLRNRFTMPFAPPHKGTPAMYGSATGIRDIPDLVEQQKRGMQPEVWVLGSTALIEYIRSIFPDLRIKPFHEYSGSGVLVDLENEIDQGNCEILIAGTSFVAQMVLRRFQHGKCRTNNGKPVGIIGEPMNSGLSHFAIGVSKDLPTEVVDTLSYWINILMICDPNNELGDCPDGNLDTFYHDHIGGPTGKECGYVMYPQQESSLILSKGEIAGIVAGAVGFVIILISIWHFYSIKKQEKRYKERFVQQIARNIEIGPSPGLIAPGKLVEEILHIGQGKGVISKPDLAKWLHDVKMEVITEKDFNALWNAMDVNGTGVVNAVEFIVFLSACGPEFENVYAVQEKMSQIERLKLAAHRLTNLAEVGEESARRIENKLDRSSRDISPTDRGSGSSTMEVKNDS